MTAKWAEEMAKQLTDLLADKVLRCPECGRWMELVCSVHSKFDQMGNFDSELPPHIAAALEKAEARGRESRLTTTYEALIKGRDEGLEDAAAACEVPGASADMLQCSRAIRALKSGAAKEEKNDDLAGEDAVVGRDIRAIR